MHETFYRYHFFGIHMFPSAMHGISRIGVRRDCPESFNRADFVFRIHARREDGAFDWFFLWIACGHIFWEFHRFLFPSLYVYWIYERKVLYDFLSPGYQTSDCIDSWERLLLWINLLCHFISFA